MRLNNVYAIIADALIVCVLDALQNMINNYYAPTQITVYIEFYVLFVGSVKHCTTPTKTREDLP